VLNAYRRNFLRAGLPTKAGILRDAAADPAAAGYLAALYGTALDFVDANMDLLQDDPDFMVLALEAVKGAGAAAGMDAAGGAASGHAASEAASVDAIWGIFSDSRDTTLRTAALDALSLLGAGNSRLSGNLIQYIAFQNNLARSGVKQDNLVLTAAIQALGVILGGSGSSQDRYLLETAYPVLFSVLSSGYPDTVSAAALTALSNLAGDYGAFLLGVIETNPLPEKLAAFRAGSADRKLPPETLAALAEAALRVSLDALAMAAANAAGGIAAGNAATGAAAAAATADIAAARSLAAESAALLVQMQWKHASPLMLRYYYQAQGDYNAGNIDKATLLGAFQALAVCGGAEAAQDLSLQLGYMNSRTESGSPVDEDIVLATIDTLGAIGHKVAFDYLLYVRHLPYSPAVQAAAEKALGELAW
jgi:hypothetical protein